MSYTNANSQSISQANTTTTGTTTMKINDLSAELNISVDNIRLMLSETNAKWESVKEITEAEAQVIRNSCRAQLSGSQSVELVADMPVNEQRAIVVTAAEVLNTKITLSIDRELEAHQALTQVRNMAVGEIYKNADVELANYFEERAKNTAEQTYLVLENIQSQLGKVDALDLKVTKSARKIDDFLSKFKAGLTQ
ncbi:MAG: hypothetical protein KME29_31295 [Calothrix sp. FI2-JRJ7]|jgi:uncharacterized Zn ribbon protein|nr:hypothetical protein [Calothrix sp. FI2-JRJ7]